jgi:hypothetical protein
VGHGAVDDQVPQADEDAQGTWVHPATAAVSKCSGTDISIDPAVKSVYSMADELMEHAQSSASTVDPLTAATNTGGVKPARYTPTE